LRVSGKVRDERLQTAVGIRAVKNPNDADENLNWKQMLSSPMSYLLLALLAAGAVAGLMIAANASQIGQQMFGLTAALFEAIQQRGRSRRTSSDRQRSRRAVRSLSPARAF
jgi:hypothetical protein